MNESKRIIVIGIGNILMSDDGLGVRVVEKLMAEYSFPENVEIYDGGATGMKGLLPLIEDADHLIVADAIKGPGQPGDSYRYTLDDFKLTIPKKMSAHDIGLIECLTVAQILERMPDSVVIVGAKPADVTTPSMGLTETINQKLSELANMILDELRALGVSPTPKEIASK